jgi:hypothetical protein
MVLQLLTQDDEGEEEGYDRRPERSFELLSVNLYAAATLVEYRQAEQARHQLKQ